MPDKVVFTGTGTSQGIPVIGCSCKVCTSDDPRDKRTRTSAHIVIKGFHFQIDVGADFRQQMLSNRLSRVDAVLLTHEHMDHIAGLDDLRPLIFLQNKPIPIYGSRRVIEAVKNQYPYAFVPEEKRYPGAPELIPVVIEDDSPFDIQGIEIIPLNVLHGDWPVLGFRFGDFSYITDANFMPEKTFELLKDTKYFVINALRKQPHYSHFNLEQALEIAHRVNAQKTYLTHISHDLGLHAEVETQLSERVFLAYDGLNLDL
ncbi:MAG: MBL fold metallo-hydrolase [Thermaurantimonas sp.]